MNQLKNKIATIFKLEEFLGYWNNYSNKRDYYFSPPDNKDIAKLIVDLDSNTVSLYSCCEYPHSGTEYNCETKILGIKEALFALEKLEKSFRSNCIHKMKTDIKRKEEDFLNAQLSIELDRQLGLK